MPEPKSLLIGIALGLIVTLTTAFDDEGKEGRYQLESSKIYQYDAESAKETTKEHLVKIDTKTGKVYKHVQFRSGGDFSHRWLDITGEAYLPR
ncbi:MAG: hypothetical protein VB980_05060 [Opitutales bacterium]|jgi:hypothetical protein